MKRGEISSFLILLEVELSLYTDLSRTAVSTAYPYCRRIAGEPCPLCPVLGALLPVSASTQGLTTMKTRFVCLLLKSTMPWWWGNGMTNICPHLSQWSICASDVRLTSVPPSRTRTYEHHATFWHHRSLLFHASILPLLVSMTRARSVP